MEDFWRIRAKDTAWGDVLHLASSRKYAKGEVIIRAGEMVDSLFYLESGEVRMIRTSMEGSEKILMYIEEGTLFGETPFFTGQPILSTFVCSQPATIWRFSRQSVFADLLPNHPEIVTSLLHTFATKVSTLSNQSASMGLQNVGERLCTFLYVTSGDSMFSKDQVELTLSMKMRDIANLLGVHRTTLYKAIRDLEKDGIFENFTKDSVLIADVSRFLELVHK